MHPLLLEIKNVPFVGDLQFHSYATFAALAFLIPTLLASAHGARIKPMIFIPPQGAVWTLLSALIGAKAFWVFQFRPWTEWYRSFYLWEAGYVFYGGLILAIPVSILYLVIIRALDWRAADLCAVYTALGFSIGRFSCFLNGCCWGVRTPGPFGLTFPKGTGPYQQHLEEHLITASAERSLPVHPTQLYLIIGCFLIFLYLLWQYRRPHFLFSTSMLLLFWYGVLRFGVEILRGESARSVFGVMTVSQTISAVLMISASLVYYVLEKRWRRAAAGAAAGEHGAAPVNS